MYIRHSKLSFSITLCKMTRSKGSKTHSPCFPGTNNWSRLVNACMLSHISPARLFATPWPIARQAPLSIGCSRQEYRSGLPFASPADLPDPGIKHGFDHDLSLLHLLHWQVSSLPLVPREALDWWMGGFHWSVSGSSQEQCPLEALYA